MINGGYKNAMNNKDVKIDLQTDKQTQSLVELIEAEPVTCDENADIEPVTSQQESIGRESEEPPSAAVLETQRISGSGDALHFIAAAGPQFRENYKVATKSDACVSIKAGLVVGSCGAIIAFLRNPTSVNSHLFLTIGMFICVTMTYFLVAWRKAEKGRKSKYVLSDEKLIAYDSKMNISWQVGFPEMKKAVIVAASKEGENLEISTSENTYVLSGLASPEELLRQLPDRIRVDSSQLAEKLQALAKTIHYRNIEGEVSPQEDFEERKSLLDEVLRDFPESAHLLPVREAASKKSLRDIALSTLVAIIFIALSPALAIPLLPILLVGIRRELTMMEKATNCLYISSPDAMFELDCKRGLLSQISMTRITLASKLLKKDWECIHIDGQSGIPISFDKPSFSDLQKHLRNYPHTKRT